MPPDRRSGGGPGDRSSTTGPSTTTGPSVTLAEATAADLDRVEELLATNDLPTSDVRTSSGRFYLARDGDAVVGVGGVERRGSTGLLRSVVIEASSRGDGYGTALCTALEDRARREGVETLYLLTTTAAAFFEGLGYRRVDRQSAPASVRSTAEFTELCPTSATCMRKRVE